MALFHFWNAYFFKKEFFISRDEAMALSKIGSKTTYHRCIRELSLWKYILYRPSHNPFKGSRIKMYNFETSSGQAMYQCHTNIGTSSGQALVPIIKHIQTIENNKTDRKQKILKNSFSKNLENPENENPGVPKSDNLRTREQKKYDKPL